ncbi:MAG: T9SS type A sorting domain-containing protein [Schleiferiaceae bacterium]|nr:T9SS type A sorting domain-containing protein [Schleiferiaceae bacterium]
MKKIKFTLCFSLLSLIVLSQSKPAISVMVNTGLGNPYMRPVVFFDVNAHELVDSLDVISDSTGKHEVYIPSSTVPFESTSFNWIDTDNFFQNTQNQTVYQSRDYLIVGDNVISSFHSNGTSGAHLDSNIAKGYYRFPNQNQWYPISTTSQTMVPISLRNDSIYIRIEAIDTAAVVSGINIQEFDEVENFRLLPNPAQNSIRISQTYSGVQQVLLYNLKGELLIKSESSELDISHLKPTTYILQVIFEDGTGSARKFEKVE